MSRPIGLKQFIESAPATEALTMQQRLARARSLKKNKAKIAIGRKKAARKIADMETLKKRARKQARNLLLKKITKDIPKGELSFARRQSIEKQLDKYLYKNYSFPAIQKVLIINNFKLIKKFKDPLWNYEDRIYKNKNYLKS